MLPQVRFCEPYTSIVAQIPNLVNSNRGQTGIFTLNPIFSGDWQFTDGRFSLLIQPRQPLRTSCSAYFHCRSVASTTALWKSGYLSHQRQKVSVEMRAPRQASDMVQPSRIKTRIRFVTSGVNLVFLLISSSYHGFIVSYFRSHNTRKSVEIV